LIELKKSDSFYDLQLRQMIYFTVALLLFWITSSVPVTRVTAADPSNFAHRGKRDLKPEEGQVISGSFIVQLADSTDVSGVRATAVETANKLQEVKQLLIANGTLSKSYAVTHTKVEPSLIFTNTIKGFSIRGVSEEISSMLVKMANVVRVESNRVVSINGALDKDSRNRLSRRKNQASFDNEKNKRMLQSKSQVIPWGIKRVGGPIKPNPYPQKRVFIIDTGIAPVEDLNIDKALSKNFAPWYYSGPPNPQWYDGHGHGTHVAGTVAALDNDINVVGVVPGAYVVAVRVLDEDGSGTYEDVIAGIDYAASVGKEADVVNMSLGGSFSEILNAAVEKAARKGIKFALAAGNSMGDAQYYSPASATGENITTVSCYDDTDTFCWFSNYGSVVDYSGPGLDVESLIPDGGTDTYSGTSMSTPHIAGLLFAGSIQIGGFVKCDPDGEPDPIAVASVKPTGPAPAPAPFSSPKNQLVITIMTDGYASSETAWTLFQILPNAMKLIASKAIGAYSNRMLYSEKYLLGSGTYKFNITDALGDGIFSPGYYSVTLGDTVLKSEGGNFTYFDAFNFTVGSSTSPTAVPIPVTSNQFDFTMLTDYDSYGITWTLFEVTQRVPKLIYRQLPGTYSGSDQLYTEQYFLDIGTYQFNITEDFDDDYYGHVNGLLCPGYFSISLGGKLLKKKDSIKGIDSTSFSVVSVPSNQLLFTILTDAFASTDTAWTLHQLLASSRTLIASKEVGAYGNNMPYTEQFLLGAGRYQFNLTDDYGDGIVRPGQYSISLGGAIIATTRPFTFLDSYTFIVTAAVPTPTKPVSKPTVTVPMKPAAPKPAPKVPLPFPSKPAPKVPFPMKPVTKPTVAVPMKPAAPKPAPKVPFPMKPVTTTKKARAQSIVG
jgi:hypothetical protein